MRSFARGASRAVAVAACGAAALLVAAACTPSGPIAAEVPESALADAPWEAAFDADDMTETVTGRTFRATDAELLDRRFVPQPGVRVELLVPRPDGRCPLVKVGEATSGADGRFSVGRVPPNAWAIRTYADGLLGMLTGEGLRMPGAVLVAPGGERMCGMTEIREVTGRVTDRHGGAPVAGARVQATSLGFHETGTTGADGSFRFSVPTPGCVVSVVDPAWDVARTPVTAPGKEPLELRTARTDPLAGQVVAAEDGRPLAGAVVMSLDDPSKRTRTGEDGRFSLPLPRTGRIVAFGAGRAWKSYGLHVAGEQEIRLPVATGVTGRVVDAAGRPLAGARLYGITTNRAGALERVFGPLSGPDGSFDFSWMPRPLRGSKRPASVLAWHRRLGASGAVLLPAKAPVELSIAGRRKLSVVLKDSAGAPVAAARIAASWEIQGLDEERSLVLGIPLSRVVATGADGTASLAGLPSDAALHMSASWWGVELAREIPLGAGDEAVALQLPRGKSLAGKFADRGGHPPGAAGVVTARLLDQPGVTVERSCATVADGAFRFDDLPPGRYELRGTVETWDLVATAEASPGAEDVKLLVERSGKLAVRLRFDGEPDAASRETVRLRIEDPADPTLPQRKVVSPPGEDGRLAAMGAVRPGSWRIVAEAGAWRGAVGPFDVADGADLVHDLHLEHTVILRARVLTHDGIALAGVPFVARPVRCAKGTIQSFLTGAGGVVDSAGFAAGRWEIRVSPAGRAPLVVETELPSAEPLDLRLPPCGDLVCRIPDEDAPEGAAEGFVTLLDTEGRPLFAWPEDVSQMRSRFRIDGLTHSVRIVGVPAGKVRLEATLSGVRRKPKDAEVRMGATVTVDL